MIWIKYSSVRYLSELWIVDEYIQEGDDFMYVIDDQPNHGQVDRWDFPRYSKTRIF